MTLPRGGQLLDFGSTQSPSATIGDDATLRVPVLSLANPQGNEVDLRITSLCLHYDFHDVYTSVNGTLQSYIDSPAYLVVYMSLHTLLTAFPHLDLKALRRLCHVHAMTFNCKSKRQLHDMLSRHSCSRKCGVAHIVLFKGRLYPRAQQLSGIHNRWVAYTLPYQAQTPTTGDHHAISDHHTTGDHHATGDYHATGDFDATGDRPSGSRVDAPQSDDTELRVQDGNEDSDVQISAVAHQADGACIEAGVSHLTATISDSSALGESHTNGEDLSNREITEEVTSTPECSTTHLEPLSEDDKLNILNEWEHAMSSQSLASGVCASCSGSRQLSGMKWVDSHNVNLELLTNPDLELIHRPQSYSFNIYQGAILDPRGMESTEHLGKLLLCQQCNRALKGGKMPRFALANHLYFARDQLPELVRQAFEQSSLFERRLICRGRYNTISCRYTGTGYHAGTEEGLNNPNHSIASELSRARLGVKGNILVVPTDSIRLQSVIPPTSTTIRDTMCVVFVGGEKPTMESISPRHKAPVLVRRTRVKIMIDFLLEFNRCYTPDANFSFSQANLDLLLPPSEEEGMLPTVEIGHLERTEATDVSSADYTPRGDDFDVPDDGGELVFENVGYTEGDMGPTNYHAMKYLAMERCRRGFPFILSGTGNAPVPDFNNPNLLSWLFPHLDPWGIAGFLHPNRRVKISVEQQLRHMLTSADRVFERDEQFAFVFYNIIRKQQVASRVRFSVSPHTHRRLTTSILAINPDTLADMAAKFKADSGYVPQTAEEKQIHAIMSSITLVSHHVPGSNGHKLVLRNQIRALINHQGTPTLFLTLNPADVDNPVVRLMAGEDVDLENVTGDEAFDSWRRRIFAAKHPAACAIFFDTVITQFIRIGLQYNPRRGRSGVFGKCTAYYGTVEAQGKGTLHCHMLIWLEGHLAPHDLRSAMLQSPDYRDKVIQWVESMIKCEFPPPASLSGGERSELMSVQPLERVRHYSLGNPHPGTTRGPSTSLARDQSNELFWSEFNQFITQLLHEYHWHVHNMSCWKYLRKGERMSDENCRLRMDGKTRPITTIHPESGEIFLRRLHPRIAAYNDLVTFMLKSNSEVKFIGSGKAARDLVYYITDYVTKPSLPVHAGMAALQYALQKVGRVVNANPECRTRAVNASAIVAAVNSMMGRQEISHPQVMSYLIGGGDYYTSHSFSVLSFGALLAYFDRRLAETDDRLAEAVPTDVYPEALVMSDSLDVREDSVTTSNQQQDYIYRSSETVFDALCVYDFVSLVKKEPIPKTLLQRTDNDDAPIKGLFISPEHQQQSTHRLVMRTHPYVPVLLGPSIPNPKRSIESKELWAKYIVILFFPWRSPLDLKSGYATWLDAYEAREDQLTSYHRQVIANMNAFSESSDERSLAPLQRKRPRDLGDDDEYQRIDVPFPGETRGVMEDDGEEINHYFTPDIPNPFLSFHNSNSSSSSLDGYISRRIGPEIVPILDQCYTTIGNADRMDRTGTELTVDDLPRVSEYQSFMRVARQKRARESDTEAERPGTSVDASSQEVTEGLADGSIAPRVSVTTISGDSDDQGRPTTDVWPFANLVPEDVVERVIEDMNLRSNAEQLKAFKTVSDHLIHNNPSQLLMYVSGVGGTGKSHVIKAIVQLFKALQCERSLLLGAPTGIAAVLIGGQTMHSLAFINSNGRTGKNPALISTWRHVRYLIVDEVSMIGAKFLSIFSNRVREAKMGVDDDVSQPFGGVNVIFMGDFGQLKPPVQHSLYAHALTKKLSFRDASSVDGISATNGVILWRQVSVVVELVKNQRHTADPEYGAFLMRLRAGICRPMSPTYPWDDWSYLTSRLLVNLSSEELLQFSNAPIIVGSKATRDALNAKLIAYNAARLGADVQLYHSIDSVKKSRVPVPVRDKLWNVDSSIAQEALGRLPMFIGMKVMITENIAFGSGIVNGAEGVIEDFSYNMDAVGVRTLAVAYVRIKGCNLQLPGLDKDVVPIFPVSTTIKYPFHVNGDVAEKGFSRKQVPLVPAYAYTDFKSQGRTLDFAFVDLATARGQGVYVMLSRVKGLKGIAILRWFHPSKIYGRLPEELREEITRIANLVDITNSTVYPNNTLP